MTSLGSRFLAENGDDTAIALTGFWLSVQEAFRRKTLLWNAVGPDGVGGPAAPSSVVDSMVTSSGKSWEFPIIGDDPTPVVHTPGTELLGQQIDMSKGSISIDQILVAHSDIALDHQQMSHFPTMQKFGRRLGRSLAITFDKDLFIIGVRAANTAASVGFHSGGNAVNRVAATVAVAYPFDATGAANFYEDILTLARLMDEDDVPEDERWLTMTPRALQVLTMGNSNYIFDTDFGRTENHLMRQTIGVCGRFNILPTTNHLPTTNITGARQSKYEGNFTPAGTGEPVALALCGAGEGDAAIGYVAAAHPSLGPIYTYMSPDERRNTQFLKAQMMVGADILAPYCAGVIQVTSS
tara:strand:+ start:367 stop:1425 length:1059 start_codon:yes stop_codon:yes gene_type:complete